MKGGILFKKIIYSSAFLAVTPAVVFLMFLSPVGYRYNLLVEQTAKSPMQTVYADLNSDSICELVQTGKGLPYYYIVVRDSDNAFYDQWNLKDSIDPRISQFFIGNYDHDLYKEIYVFTYKGDSLFLNVNEILEPRGTRIERKFITKIGYLNNKALAILYPAGFFDVNDDGKDELYFSLSSAFGMGPRKVFFYDLVNDKLNSSQFTGNIILEPEMTDVDGDNKPEIFGLMSASGNFRSNVPFSDSSTWLMVFNEQLKFKFPPVEFPGFANALKTKAYKGNNFRGYVVSHWRGGTDTTVMKSRIMVYSPDGKLIRYRFYSDFGYTGIFSLFVPESRSPDKIYIIANKIIELNENLEIVRTVGLPFYSLTFQYQADIDDDKEDEFLIYSEEDQKLIVYNNELDKLTELKFKTPTPQWLFSHYYSRDNKYKLFLRSGNEGYFLSLKKNSLYFLGYLAYPGVYFLFFIFIILIKRINTYQVVQKENLKNRLITLQLQGIKSQLDPHFTFNTLNSVASLIYMDDRQAAYDYMIKFTELLRRMLNDADRIYRSLYEELEFLTTYLELEKLRFGDKFSYDIEIGEEISKSEQVPKLVLQTFAENAIKHGIMPSSQTGFLKIKVLKEKDYLKLTIEDNGVGRKVTSGHSTSTGKGLKITGEFYDILNQINKKPIKHFIVDLYDEKGNPAGTRVEVWVPVA